VVAVAKYTTTVKTKTTKANRRQNPNQAVCVCVCVCVCVRLGVEYYHEPADVQMVMCFGTASLTLLKAVRTGASAKPFSLPISVSLLPKHKVQSKVLWLIAKSRLVALFRDV